MIKFSTPNFKDNHEALDIAECRVLHLGVFLNNFSVLQKIKSLFYEKIILGFLGIFKNTATEKFRKFRSKIIVIIPLHT